MKQINGFKGFVGYSIRELSQHEMSIYCSSANSLNLTTLPLIQEQVNFTSDFKLRSYSSGCYYYEVDSGKWSSDGLEVSIATNLRGTFCSSSHLTSFAGGFLILPTEIDFEYVFANGSFSRNPIIYATLIIITTLFLSFALLAGYMDKQDLKKNNIIACKDNYPNDSYFYEITAFTGHHDESGTQSEVNKKINFFLIHLN
jgi:hypothetical protein